MNSLKNKVIVVTGGNGLLGTSIIQDLKKFNSISINLDINSNDDLDSGTLKCDVTDSNSIDLSIKKILKKYKRIDGWVNNAYPRTNDWGNKFEEVELYSWKKNIDLQLNSLYDCCKKVLEVMDNQKSGVIVNIASIYGMVGPDFNLYDQTNMTMPPAYSAIKGGVINFTKYLASYYGNKNIRINCVSPGGIFNKQNLKFVENYNKKVPLGRMAQNTDISPSVCFLLSDYASYITGHNLVVDGGWTII
jgi:NAD(P)-dependent dehydrogenase (short-subunit alcohol dehydrogenase family)